MYGNTYVDFYRVSKKAALTGTFDPFTLGHRYLAERGAKDFDEIHIVMLDNPDKKPMFSVERRLEIIKASAAGLEKIANIEYSDGFTVDYCRARGIKYIIRGVRNAHDAEYEQKMSEHNMQNGGITTVLYDAVSDISAAEVRRRVADNLPLDDFIAKEALKGVR
jgi:pantetheine-phosphate adenylyltransferase